MRFVENAADVSASMMGELPYAFSANPFRRNGSVVAGTARVINSLLFISVFPPRWTITPAEKRRDC
jgi:hypothetical protein